jgi:hypothetical protein
MLMTGFSFLIPYYTKQPETHVSQYRSKLGAQKRGTAIAAAKVKESIAATTTSAAGTSNEAGTDGRKRNIICQLIG